MTKKTWGIILIVLGALGILGGFANGSILAMGPISLIGFLAAAGACFFFGIRMIMKDKKDKE